MIFDAIRESHDLQRDLCDWSMKSGWRATDEKPAYSPTIATANSPLPGRKRH